MTKARKASASKQPKRDIKWANMIFLAIGVLVILSMIVGSIISSTPQPQVIPPTVIPATVVPTAAP